MRVIAFDPGGTTGFKCFDKNTMFTGGQLTGQHHSNLMNLLESSKPTDVAYETFEYRNTARAGLVLDSREYIGVIKLYGQLHTNVTVQAQTPAMAKGFVSDAILKKGGLYVPGRGHENDACRHLIYYLCANKKHPYDDVRASLLKLLYK